MSQRRRNTMRKKVPRRPQLPLGQPHFRDRGEGQYKRSLAVQDLSGKAGVGDKNEASNPRQEIWINLTAGFKLKQTYQDILYSIFALIIAVFIIYSLFPWNKINSLIYNYSVGWQKPAEPTPGALYRHSITANEPFIKLSAYGGDFGTKATALLAIKSGDTLRTTLQRNGFTSEEAEAAQQSLAKGDLAKGSLVEGGSEKAGGANLKAGDSVEVLISDEGLLSGIKFNFAPGRLGVLERKSKDFFEFSVREIEKTTRERMVVGSIKSSFAAAAMQAGLSYDIVDDLVDIFSDRVSFHRDFRKGDRFTLIYHEHEMADATKTTAGPILAAALEVKGEHFLAVRYVGIDGKARYFNEQGHLIGNTFLRYPLKFSRISSYFSDGRLHPVLKIKRPHHGVDFAAPTGTPVRTIGDGVVTFAGRKGGHGIIVEIRHGERFTTGYSHLSAISPGLTRGKRVQRGDLIGKVGMTGLATGPHLHFSLYDNGVYTDPLQAKLPQMDDLRAGIKISKEYLSRALYTLTHFQTVKTDPIVLQALSSNANNAKN